MHKLKIIMAVLALSFAVDAAYAAARKIRYQAATLPIRKLTRNRLRHSVGYI